MSAPQQPQSSFMNYPPTAADFCMRKIMRQSTAAICKMAGFDFIQPRTLELLNQMMTCYFSEAARSAKALSEHGGRTMVNPSDAFLALVDMGTDMDGFTNYLMRIRSTGSCVIPPPRPQMQPPQSHGLKIGERRPLPPHIPNFLPSFPDPHTYIKTEVSGEPDATYERMRILAAENKKNSEASLLKYMLSIHPTVSLYRDYEKRLKEEALLFIEHEKDEKRRRLGAIKSSRERQKLQKELAGMDSVPENLLDDEPDDQMETNEKPEDDEKIMKEIELEDMFRTKETENSLIRRKLPYFTTVFKPFTDKRPYLSALLTEEIIEEEKQAQEAAGQAKASDASVPEDSANYVDNPYLQAPRIADISMSPKMDHDMEGKDQSEDMIEASELEDMPVF